MKAPPAPSSPAASSHGQIGSPCGCASAEAGSVEAGGKSGAVGGAGVASGAEGSTVGNNCGAAAAIDESESGAGRDADRVGGVGARFGSRRCGVSELVTAGVVARLFAEERSAGTAGASDCRVTVPDRLKFWSSRGPTASGDGELLVAAGTSWAASDVEAVARIATKAVISKRNPLLIRSRS